MNPWAVNDIFTDETGQRRRVVGVRNAQQQGHISGALIEIIGTTSWTACLRPGCGGSVTVDWYGGVGVYSLRSVCARSKAADSRRISWRSYEKPSSAV